MRLWQEYTKTNLHTLGLSVPKLDEDDLQDKEREKVAIKNLKEAREQIKRGYI